jgi:RsiW-degrading membrane proteinase PrsW (M82 family)
MARNETWSRRYAILALAIAPLLMPLGDSGGDAEPDFETRVERTLEAEHATESQRETVGRVYAAFEQERATESDVIDALPRHRLEGALLPRKTWLHWAFAIASAAFYFTFLLLVFPPGKTDPKHLLLAGLFTATIGILLLLLVQQIAFSGVWIHGGGQLAILFLLLQFIGYSYSAALDPSNGFVASFLGFTAGVGFCEELCKQLPLLYHFRTKATLDWRGACLWGFASGVGFGVSEGITYSSDFYNGRTSGAIYVVRFVACVALHAIWAASAAIVLCRRQVTVQGRMPLLALIPPIIAIIIVPMALHGAYDTLLKKDHALIAFAVAVASFGWLAFQVERAVSEDRGVRT